VAIHAAEIALCDLDLHALPRVCGHES
jgi:hypothetical protein